MNEQETPSNDLPPPSEADAGEAKPAVKRRSRKAAASPAAEAPSVASGEAGEGEAAPVAVKTPRRRKAAAATSEAPIAAEDADVLPARVAVEPAQAAPVEVATVEAAPTGAEAQSAPGEGSAESGDASETADVQGGERLGRRRNRRRGRGRGEGEGGEGELGELAAAPAQPVADPAEAVERFAEVLSGAYDAEPPEPDDEASVEQQTKRVLRPEPDAPKLHKVLAQSGIGSRRDMEQMIADGRVTVNDEVAHIGMRIAQGDRIAVAGKPVRVRILPPVPRLLAYHKPAGEVVTFNDPEGRPTVFRRLPRLQNGKWQSVGRLDINTEGLLLFTTSGELANQLMHPRFGVEREYAVRVLGSLDDEQRAKLLEGVEIDGQPAAFKSIEDGGGEGANRWYRVVITEGRNREVRKLFDAVGLAVSRLIRIRYGTVVLPRGLKRGVWVELGDQDLRLIRRLASGTREGQPSGNREERRGRGKPGRGDGRQEGRQDGRQDGRNRGPQPGRERNQPEQRARRDNRFDEVSERDEEQPSDESFERIPNPLEQTFDRRFAKGRPKRPNQGFGSGSTAHLDQEGLPPGSIPNPLEQTFDRRFVKGSQRINAGFGRHDAHQPESGGAKKGGPKQPDPMQTSVGYIGADAYFNKLGGKKRGGGQGNRGGGGGGGGRGR